MTAPRDGKTRRQGAHPARRSSFRKHSLKTAILAIAPRPTPRCQGLLLMLALFKLALPGPARRWREGFRNGPASGVAGYPSSLGTPLYFTRTLPKLGLTVGASGFLRQGGSSTLALKAMQRSHFVLVPMRPSLPDARDAMKTVAQIDDAEELSAKQIPRALIWTLFRAGFESNVSKHVRRSLEREGSRYSKAPLWNGQRFKLSI
jgi:hypothetical protein